MTYQKCAYCGAHCDGDVCDETCARQLSWEQDAENLMDEMDEGNESLLDNIADEPRDYEDDGEGL